MVHSLKTWPGHFSALWSAEKTFELRRDDRGFSTGDQLKLLEYDPEPGKAYTGRAIIAEVTHILARFPGLKDGYVAMSIKRVGAVLHDGQTIAL